MGILRAILRLLAEWFGQRPAQAKPQPTVSQPAPAALSVAPTNPIDGYSDTTVIARTLWGEARGQGAEGMQAVCNVIQNRAAHPGWWGHDLRSVCLARKQFSCWNADSVECKAMRANEIMDTSYPIADSIALSAIAGKLPDITEGADHYYEEDGVTHQPNWAVGKTPTFIVGKPGHRQYFYRLGIDG